MQVTEDKHFSLSLIFQPLILSIYYFNEIFIAVPTNLSTRETRLYIEPSEAPLASPVNFYPRADIFLMSKHERRPNAALYACNHIEEDCTFLTQQEKHIEVRT